MAGRIFMQSFAMFFPKLHAAKSTVVVLASLVLTSCGGSEPPAERFTATERGSLPAAAPCADNNPFKNAYFGDTHVHTALSNDGRSFGSRARPADAYRYAFAGGEIKLATAKGNETDWRRVRIDRPLDFMAVTDHAEFFGEQTLCDTPTDELRESGFCKAFEEGEGRNPSLVTKIINPFTSRDSDVCGEDGEVCVKAAGIPWQETIDAAEAWQDRSSGCERTAFIAYEYSSFRMGSNLHRNVIFKNSAVPKLPISYIDAPREWRLWELLDEQCISGDAGCDALAIPHNSNISNGRMFAVDYPGADSVEEQAARARLRMKVEPIIEIMQHKGDSECRNGLPGVHGDADELCNFEKFENLTLDTGNNGEGVGECYSGPFEDLILRLGPSCLTRNSYVRYALIEGMKEEQRIGVNPFKFGITAATDTHNGTGGAVSEQNFAGHLGWADQGLVERTSYSSEYAGNTSNNAGGLTGVWAEENSRDSIFESMRRREVFGTSGPRIKPRFFAGWDYAADLCADPAMLEKAYAKGVAMGNDLPANSSGEQAPVFIASATADAGTAAEPGLALQTLQVVKGWYDENGDHHQRVFNVAGDANNGASVDMNTCKPQGEGFAQLCSVWRDPEFNANQSAVYYMRAVENPSCRYSARQCLSLPEGERPEACESHPMGDVIQERAWTSPIWYAP